MLMLFVTRYYYYVCNGRLYAQYLWAIVVIVLGEEAALSEGGGAGATRETSSVEILLGYTQHLPAALAAAPRTHHLACKTPS